MLPIPSSCSFCPVITQNLDNWCEDCLFTRKVHKEKERAMILNKAAKIQADPNWEDFSHP